MWNQGSDRNANEGDPLLPVPEGRTMEGSAPPRIHRRLGSAGRSSRRVLERVGNSSRRLIQSSQRHLVAVAENIETAVDTVKDMVHELGTDLIQEAKDVAEVVDQKLHEADDSAMPVLDMALTRTLSILPTDIAQMAAVIHDWTGDNTTPPLEETALLEPNETATVEAPSLPLAAEEEGASVPASKIPLVAYLTLGLAVIGLSSSGPILRFQTDCSPLMKMIWRQNGTILLFLPFVRADVRKNGFPKLSCAEWTNFVLVAAAYAAVRICFVQALEHTTVGNAVIFSNSQAIILLLGKLLVGSHITFLEAFGAFTAFLGAILCCEDGARGSAHAASTGEDGAAFGDILALCCGLAGVAYLITAQASRKNFSLLMFMFLIMSVANFFIIIVQVFVLKEPLTFGMDEHDGIFGFLNINRFDRLPLEFINVIICSIVGTCGYVMAMQYFDNLVMAVAGLLQPVMATFTSYFIGVGLLPTPLGWLGQAMVTAGTFAVVYKPTQKPPTKSVQSEAKAREEESEA